MSNVYSKRFGVGSGPRSGVVATVPAGKVWVVTNVDYASGGYATTTLVMVGINNVITFLMDQVPASANPISRGWVGREVLYPGEGLLLFIQPNGVTASINGYELTA